VQWEPGGINPDARRVLEAMGHVFRRRHGTLADVNAVLVTPHGLEGAADPRRGGGAAGW
jgi:gamma-glutamyltranspeptidase